MQLPKDGIFLYRPNVDFCVWVLKQDGLKVAPFDKHASGDALLRQAGLSEGTWSTWSSVVTSSERPIVEYVQRAQRFVVSGGEKWQAEVEKARKKPLGSGAALRLTAKLLWADVQAAREVAGPKGSKITPPDAWQGPAEALPLLRALWRKFNKRFGGPRIRTQARLYSPALEAFVASSEYSAWRDELEVRYRNPESMPAVLLVNYPGPTTKIVDSMLVLGAQQWSGSPALVREKLGREFSAMGSSGL